MQKYVKYIFLFCSMSFLIRIFFFQGDYSSIMDGIKYFFYPLIDAYLLAFQNPNTALLLFLLIIFLCAGCVYWIYFEKYVPLRKKLDNSIEAATIFQSTIYYQEINPLEYLIDIEKDEILKPFVLKFKNNIVSHNQENINFSSFNINMLETRGFPLKIISVIPGYFVGFGLVFTFLGLVAALYFSAQGMKAGDYESAKLSLMNLLHASSFKFTTSIAGISSSLLISILYKSLLHKLHLKVSTLGDIVDDIFDSVKRNMYSYEQRLKSKQDIEKENISQSLKVV